ncbi:MAG: MBOAT family protein [Anaerolineales bacterium]|nr:MBOAT family protein [Anaerolineales bacterium]
MSFVSLEFTRLLTAVLILLAISRAAGWRKFILLLASCVFYAYWDWRFLGLLVFVTVMDYYISIWLVASRNERTRKAMLFASVVVNLSILGYFKYFNFFIDSLNLILTRVGFNLPELQIILPIGISFYIFETLSYVIDVYRRHTEPADSLLDYAVFVTFFPRLVAGPIMRASHFLPQLKRGIHFSRENFVVGAHLFAQGLLKKVVVADTLALLSDTVYELPWVFSSAVVWLGVLSFAVQIYFDFSGYSDMATGVARLLGFELPVNFNLPFTSQSLTEFWQRWHISLSTWMRDYVYIPLGGNRHGAKRTNLNMLITMLIGGLWHGASWNFVVWGGMHGLALWAERIFSRGKQPQGWSFPGALLKALAVYLWVAVACVFFRSPSLQIAGEVFKKLFFISPVGAQWFFAPALFYVLIVLAGGFYLRIRHADGFLSDTRQPYVIPVIAAEYLFAFLFAAGGTSPFIYFQF